MKTIKNLIAEEIRKSILQLAIQGKLVKQNPNDEPASELVKRIYAEKEKLIKEGKIKKDKNESYIFKGDDNCYYEKIGKNEPVKLEELPFDIPDNWTWIRQKEICWLDNGVKTTGEQLPYLEAKVIRGFQKPNYVSSGVIVDESKRVILVDGENSGEIMTPPFKGYLGSTFKIFSSTNHFDYQFLLFIFEFNKSKYKNSKVGAAIPHLNKQLFRESFIAVPPIEEQRRIVDRINSFEPLLDKYDSLEKKLSSLEAEFPEKLKKSILQYAIEGKLVKQDPSDEPASVLLERIKAEKERLIKKGKIKRDKSESYIYQGDDKNYYENLPNWLLVTYLSFAGNWRSGATPERGNSLYYGGNIPWIKTGELNNGIISNSVETVTESALDKYSLPVNKKGNVLIAMYGATIGKLGIAGIELTTNQACCGCEPYAYVNNRYLFYYLMSCKQKFIRAGEGGAQPNISKEKILSFPFVIGPISYQKKVVEKLDTIFKKYF